MTKNHGASKFGSGKFLGPARVLATETRSNPDGSIRPGSIVWLYRSGRLLKAAPEQLRPASWREEAWVDLSEDQPIPWTIHGMLDGSTRKTYDDISSDWSEADFEEMEVDEQEKRDVPVKRHRYKHPVHEERPTHRPRLEEKDGLVADNFPFALLVSEERSNFLDEPDACLSVEIDLPGPKEAKRGFWTRDFEAFIINQMKKNHVEVNERRLSLEERAQFKEAKDKEVKNFVIAKVFEKLPEHLKPDRQQALKMRWILTWKVNPETSERKAKARAVVLGYMDPEYEFRPTASPTMTRTTRQLFLSMCAAFKFRVKKGDVSGAFLQGRDYARQLLCEPLPEIPTRAERPHRRYYKTCGNIDPSWPHSTPRLGQTMINHRCGTTAIYATSTYTATCHQRKNPKTLKHHHTKTLPIRCHLFNTWSMPSFRTGCH